MMPMIRSYLAVTTMILALAALAACNTVGGAGEDISAGGKAISTTAKKASDAL